jgi:hypothetical protein
MESREIVLRRLHRANNIENGKDEGDLNLKAVILTYMEAEYKIESAE